MSEAFGVSPDPSTIVLDEFDRELALHTICGL
jgi:hypothetical protein